MENQLLIDGNGWGVVQVIIIISGGTEGTQP